MTEFQEEIKGGIVPGAVRSIAYFKSASGEPVPKDQAALIEIHELNEEGDLLHITYGEIES